MFHAVGTKESPLRNSPFIQKFTLIHSYLGEDRSGIGNDLLTVLKDMSYDMAIYSNEEIPLAVLHSDLDEDQKVHALPIKEAQGMCLIGSKIGLAEMALREGLPFPKTAIAKSWEDLMAALDEFGPPVFVKADRGAGGDRVLFSNGAIEGLRARISADWFPVIVQEALDGETVSVEAIFNSGVLRGWTYSVFLEATSKFGPSSRRRYINPPKLDFEQTLIQLGKRAGLHGPVNTTWIWQTSNRTHILLEADTRPSAWHQFLPRFGFQPSFLSEVGADISRQSPLADGGVEIGLYPTELRHAIFNGQPLKVFRWLLKRPGTWDFRNSEDLAVNRFENHEVLRAPKLALLRLLGGLRGLLPIKLVRWLETAGIMSLVKKIFAIK